MRATCSTAASKISGVGAFRATSIATCRSAASSVERTCSRSGALFAVPFKAHGLPPARALVQSVLGRADEAVREREQHQLGTSIETELAHDVCAVRVDGPYRD